MVRKQARRATWLTRTVGTGGQVGSKFPIGHPDKDILPTTLFVVPGLRQVRTVQPSADHDENVNIVTEVLRAAMLKDPSSEYYVNELSELAVFALGRNSPRAREQMLRMIEDFMDDIETDGLMNETDKEAFIASFVNENDLLYAFGDATKDLYQELHDEERTPRKMRKGRFDDTKRVPLEPATFPEGMGHRMREVFRYLESVGGSARYSELVDNTAPVHRARRGRFAKAGSTGRRVAHQGFDQTLKRMVDRGILEKPERGLYQLPER